MGQQNTQSRKPNDQLKDAPGTSPQGSGGMATDSELSGRMKQDKTEGWRPEDDVMTKKERQAFDQSRNPGKQF